MTQLDELLRKHTQRIPVDDALERQALDHARHTLRVAAANERVRSPRRRSPRHIGRLTLIAGLAATIAALPAFLPGGAGNEASQLGPATASAQSLLQQAARAISRHAWQPLGPGQYFYYRQIDSYPQHNGPVPARPTEIQDVWVGANGFARIVQTGPDTVIPGGDVLIFHATPQQLQAERQRQRHGAHLRILAYSQKYQWGALDYQHLIHLPTDPSKLQRYIEQHATGGGPRFSDIFSYAENLLTGAPLPPKVSAAMYHVIGHLPGMRLVSSTHDPLGRPGVAVGLFFKDQPGRIDLIFNPRSGVLLGDRGVSLSAKAEHAPVGSVTDWTAIDRQGVVNSDHQPTRHEN
jgi:RNA polymerase sigma-70 factor (ECF subfamily)